MTDQRTLKNIIRTQRIRIENLEGINKELEGQLELADKRNGDLFKRVWESEKRVAEAQTILNETAPAEVLLMDREAVKNMLYRLRETLDPKSIPAEERQKQ